MTLASASISVLCPVRQLRAWLRSVLRGVRRGCRHTRTSPDNSSNERCSLSSVYESGGSDGEADEEISREIGKGMFVDVGGATTGMSLVEDADSQRTGETRRGRHSGFSAASESSNSLSLPFPSLTRLLHSHPSFLPGPPLRSPFNLSTHTDLSSYVALPLSSSLSCDKPIPKQSLLFSHGEWLVCQAVQKLYAINN